MDFEEEVTLNYPDGSKVECEVILKHEENGRTYIAYTDKTINQNKILRAYVSEIVKDGEETKLVNCEDMDVLRRIQVKLNQFYEDLKKEASMEAGE